MKIDWAGETRILAPVVAAATIITIRISGANSVTFTARNVLSRVSILLYALQALVTSGSVATPAQVGCVISGVTDSAGTFLVPDSRGNYLSSLGDGIYTVTCEFSTNFTTEAGYVGITAGDWQAILKISELSV